LRALLVFIEIKGHLDIDFHERTGNELAVLWQLLILNVSENLRTLVIYQNWVFDFCSDLWLWILRSALIP
jgi:hypothetical protein